METIKKFYREKYSSKLIEILKSHTAFAENEKRIVDAAYFLNEVIKRDEDDSSSKYKRNEIPSSIISKIFSNDENNYATYVRILEQENLIIIDHSYSFDKINNTEGQCKKYYITEKGREVMLDESKKYVKYNQKNPNLRFLQSVRIWNKEGFFNSLASYRTKKAIDSISNLDELIDINNNLTEKDLPKEKLEKGKKIEDIIISNNYAMIALQEKRIELNVRDNTGRLYTPLHQMSKDLKKKLVFDDKRVFQGSIDARACHPTFFALYIQSRTVNDVSDEVMIWNSIFTNENIHPIKQKLAKELGIDENKMKDVMLHLLNGEYRSNDGKKLYKWMEDNFPKLIKEWNDSPDKTQTGVQISKDFESILFRNDAITHIANKLKVTIIDNHDELLFFAENNLRLNAFFDAFKTLSRELFNFNIVLKLD